MRTLMLSLLSLFVAGAAHAAPQVLKVPGDYDTIADAVNAAQNGSTILLKRPPPVAGAPGTHVIEQPITINNKVLTIKAEYPPRPIDDRDLEEDVDVWFDVLSAASSPGVQGAFVLTGTAKLTLENLRWKQPEVLCDDRADNDGNGKTDKDDPVCQMLETPDSGDTALPKLPRIFPNDVRAVLANKNTTLTIKSCEFYGFDYSNRGNVFRAISAEIDIQDSRFITNNGAPIPMVSGDWGYGEGGVIRAEANSYVTVRNTVFAYNSQLYGGAIWMQDSTLLVDDGTAFENNSAGDGGAIYLESAEADIRGSFFTENAANLVPDGPILADTYEGGAIYAEDSSLVVKNNIFLANGSLDVAAAVLARRTYSGDSALDPDFSIVLENNAFVQNTPNKEGGASVVFDQTSNMRYVNNISFGETKGAIGAIGQYHSPGTGGTPSWPFGHAPNVHYNIFHPINPNQVFTGGLSGLPVNQVDNLFVDPLFVYYTPSVHYDWRIWRFWLDPASPGIDAGDPAVYDNNDPNNRSDIGAYGGQVPSTADDDGDGWPSIYDCNDDDATVYPFAFEACNAVDDDCNGIVDDRADKYFIDADYDGYGNKDIPPFVLCPEEPPPPLLPGAGTYVNQGGDCDDTATLVNPGRIEFCDGIDNDCNGDADDNIPRRAHYVDRDLDGFGNPNPDWIINVQCPPEGYSPFPTDCNDNAVNIHPLINYDARTHLPLANAPLERNEADRNPAFVADGIDQDCDLVDLCYVDGDRDGFGQATQPGRDPVYINDNDLNCRNLSGSTSSNDDDCDDGNAAANPLGTEVTGNGLDENCDGHDECYADLDDDGFGSSDIVPDSDLDCDNATNPTASKGGDCNDNPTTGGEQFPGQREICDGVDNNCDGRIDEIGGPDADEFYLDADGDGWGDVTQKLIACGAPLGYAARAGDCDDADPRAFPDNTEICDGIDNNCEAGVDEDDAIDVLTWYQDGDQDGYGNCSVKQDACTEPTAGGSWVKAGTECDQDDKDPLVGPPPDCGNCSNVGTSSTVPVGVGFLALALVRRRKR